MKRISILEFNKFNYTDKKGLVYEPAYKNGYWNVFAHSNELELFLKNNKIEYRID